MKTVPEYGMSYLSSYLTVCSLIYTIQNLKLHIVFQILNLGESAKCVFLLCSTNQRYLGHAKPVILGLFLNLDCCLNAT